MREAPPTERKRTEEKIAAGKNLHGTVFESVCQGTVILESSEHCRG